MRRIASKGRRIAFKGEGHIDDHTLGPFKGEEASIPLDPSKGRHIDDHTLGPFKGEEASILLNPSKGRHKDDNTLGPFKGEEASIPLDPSKGRSHIALDSLKGRRPIPLDPSKGRRHRDNHNLRPVAEHYESY